MNQPRFCLQGPIIIHLLACAYRGRASSVLCSISLIKDFNVMGKFRDSSHSFRSSFAAGTIIALHTRMVACRSRPER